MGLDDLPIESLTSIVEDRGGIVVGYSARREHGFDGLSGWVNASIPIAVVNTHVPDDRRRYNLAHELGHLAMTTSHLEGKEEEKLAHRFAAALLVPAAVAIRELGSHRRRLDMGELGLLKQKYGLSMQAWVRRAFDLNIIEQGAYKNLYVEFNRNGWRKDEPVVFRRSETPIRLEQMTLRGLAEGLISQDRAEQLCPGCSDRAALAGMSVAGSRLTPTELRKLSREQRQAILESTVPSIEEDYRTDQALTDFEAFSEEELDDIESDT